MIWPMHELSLAELAVFFGKMGELGYAIVSREDNPIVRAAAPALCCAYIGSHTQLDVCLTTQPCPPLQGKGCCSEFTFLRVEQPAHCV